MKPIKSLEIKHFKFFTDNEPIAIDGKHLLVYGENGSGKSSIYWALYTLLEACSKSEESINKYFTKGIDESLVNIYRDEDNVKDSFIKLELNNGTTYSLGFDDFSLHGRTNPPKTQRASDFMNYRFIYKISDCRHKDEIDLFPLFEKEVFPYIKTRASFQLIHELKESNDFNEIWDDLKKGPTKIAVFDGPSHIPTPTPTTVSDTERVQKDFQEKISAFLKEINSFLLEINTQGNRILQENLEYENIRFELKIPQSFNYNSGDKIHQSPKISLTIPEYNGVPIAKPQSFLNEAKLTAIGIAIRFAVLAQRADYAKGADFQLLVIDDLLISLDMSNRRKVLDMLLNNYAETYQLFILTHDRAFFEKTKRQIKASGNSSEWIELEIYEDDRNIPIKPFIKKSESFKENATKHYFNFEFPAAANSLRKACEELLDQLLPEHYKISDSGERIWQLDNLLAKAQTYYKTFPVDYKAVTEIREHLKLLLNPLSHNDLSSQIYKNELNDIFASYQKLENFKLINEVKLLDAGEKLIFSLKNPKADIFDFEIILTEELKYTNVGFETPQIKYCHFKCFYSVNGKKVPKPIEGNELEKFYKNLCKKTENQELDIWRAFSTLKGVKLKELINP